MPNRAATATGPGVSSTGLASLCMPSTITTADAIKIKAALIIEASWVLRPNP